MAGNDKNKGSEKDPQSLVGDLLRRATSPEVLAGVAGAAAAARFTKHVVEDSDEAEGDEPPEQEEASGAEASREEEPDIQGDEVDEDAPEEPRAEEDEPDEDEPEEPRAEEDEPDQDEPAEPEAAAEPEADDEAEPSPDEDGEDEGEGEEMSDSSASNGSLGSDDERMELLDQARRFAEQLTGHPVESFSSLEQDDRGWRIGVEVVELSRVPSTTDVLGSYELVLTSEGEFVDFRRAHRYYRNSTDDQSS
jgi:gas vesicle protein GvpO